MIFKYRLIVISVTMLIYLLGYLVQKYYLTDTDWIYFGAFWLGSLSCVIENMLRSKFKKLELAKLRYYMPKTY